MNVLDEVDRTRAWIVTAIAGVVALGGGSLLFPARVYRGFIWQYFWGPIYADAHGEITCAVHYGDRIELRDSAVACSEAVNQGLVVAEPGYTIVSSLGYMAVLLFMLVGVYQLISELDVGAERDLVYALVPFMLFGGALRAFEDSQNAILISGTGEPLVAYPLSSLLISPLIYFTVFFITLAALLVAVGLDRGGFVDRYTTPLAGFGVVAFVTTFVALLWQWSGTAVVDFYPQVLLTVLGIATALTAIVWGGIKRYAPELNTGTQGIGLFVIWGHAIDGVANVLSLDWLPALGIQAAYSPKHPAVRLLNDLAAMLQPQSVEAAIGTAWPFLFVKLGVAVTIIWVFNDEIFEESPRWAILLLTAIIAVGLGPGTRDMLRATFGI